MPGIFPLPRVGLDEALSQYKSPTAGEGTAGIVVKPFAQVNGVGNRARLYKFRAKNKAATAYTLMFFDKVTAIANGDAPIWQMDLPVSGEVGDDFGLWGLLFQNGIQAAISSTATTLTLAVANDVLLKALYV
jgi:hypothetical protein